MDRSVLSRINWQQVQREVQQETGSREDHNPTVSTYRWWARRPHTLIGAILDAAGEAYDHPTIADPFSGGGTVAVEAAKRRQKLYAQDLNPWAAWGLAVTLDGTNPAVIESATARLYEALRATRAKLYGTICPDHGEAEQLTIFRVREFPCANCKNTIHHFPYSLITLLSRAPEEDDAYFGCNACGEVGLQQASGKHAVCTSCIRELPLPRVAFSNKASGVPCPHCSFVLDHENVWSAKSTWRVVLVQRRCIADGEEHVHFDVPTSPEVLAGARPAAEVPHALAKPIPAGHETQRLITAGFETWGDLYPGRQVDAILAAASAAHALGVPPNVLQRLLLAISGTSEMAGYLCRWDRFHPKVFEGLANHRFSLTGQPIEINILADLGRGTLWRRLRASEEAAQAALGLAQADFLSPSHTGWKPTREKSVAIVKGSSERQALADKTVQLVLTDPPYFDSVQYGELSELFHAWMRATRVPVDAAFSRASEALPNRHRGVNTTEYESVLRRIFQESARTLADDGTVILTFHSSTLRAWWALGAALRGAGLRARSIAIVKSENENDHSKRGKRTITRDLVIECKLETARPSPIVITKPTNAEERELVAAGLAGLIESSSYGATRDSFLIRTKRMRSRRIEFPEPQDIQDKLS